MAAAGGGGGGRAGPWGPGAGRALQTAMRAASGALEMDSAGRTREAYVEYLKSIALIAQALQEEAVGTDGSEGVTADTPKMLKLAEQCLERVKSIAAALGKAQAKPAAQERGAAPAALPRHRRVLSDEGGKLSPFLPPEIFQKLQITEAQSTRKELTPLEEASLQNQKLKAAYEARVARLNPSQALQKTSLTLSLQRQMMENLVIAKAREETLQRKMEERRLRLQEAANRRFSSSVALTPEEQEQRALYAAILEYEQDHDWPRQWKAKLKRSPADLSVVSGLFSCLLRQAAVPDAAGLRGAEHRCRQGPVPGLLGGSLLPTAVGPAAGSLQERAPAPRGGPGPQHGAAPARWPHRHGAGIPALAPGTRLPCVRLRHRGPAPHPTGDLSPQEAGVHCGADDLLPILSYVVLQTGLPQLLSECAALEEFIHEGMCAGSALRQQYGQQYRHCLEREFRRGRAVPCSDPSFVERLRWRLRREPSVLRALQEDAPELLARGLRGWPDPGRALPGLVRAFRLLELAAVNLYLFPWRKEFGTVQTFSGAYVHSLRSALPEDDLERSFARLGYERQDQHRLTVSRLPPEPELLAAACGFLACRLECEILVEVMLRLRPHQPSAQDLLRARWLAGDMEACVEMLQQMGIQPEVAVGCSDNVDLYQPVPGSPEDMEGEDMLSPAPQSDPGSPLDALDLPMRSWDCCGDLKVGQELVLSVGNPDLDTSSSRLFRQQDLSGASSRFPTRAVGSRTPPVLGEPQDSPCPSAPEEAPELPCYQLHTCLRRGALPSYCCTTCQQLHTGACAAGLACRSRHRGQELRSERQQRLWLQRSEVDMLLSESCGPQS
ncbi:uncharacterized protein AAGF69_016203 isoform 3-T3 [Amazona ochrocephala]